MDSSTVYPQVRAKKSLTPFCDSENIPWCTQQQNFQEEKMNPANLIDEKEIGKMLKKAANPTDLQRSLKKMLPNNVTNLTVTLNGARVVHFDFQRKHYEIVA